MVGSLTPVVTACLEASLGRTYSLQAWIGVAVACGGGAMVTICGLQQQVEGDSKTTIGLALSGLAMLTRAGKTVLMDHTMRSGTENASMKRQVGPAELIVLVNPPIAFFTFVLSYAFEDISPYRQLMVAFTGGGASNQDVLFLTLGILGMWMSVLGVSALGTQMIFMLGSSAMQMASKFAVFITAALSAGFLNEPLPPAEVFGAIVVIFGAYIFESAQSYSKGTGRNEENTSILKRCRDEGMTCQCIDRSAGESDVILGKTIKGLLCRSRLPASRQPCLFASLVLSSIATVVAFSWMLNPNLWSHSLSIRQGYTVGRAK
eukprot:gnl/MRDRNA2_/MRDRNA2_21982_c0_seq1.p1 gnl/MRDRNA2_/MRDRNA2_21982_c0~~gnl/MRDRNA2_/MRDRNA2_21982_c0_seq1.p1  ORF type:complete len:334 (-),score=38.52 gnl/MRDRNA2_/MRDRNA2_21982_c0_seq1:157-1113(-)